jgi:hypothetical protein
MLILDFGAWVWIKVIGQDWTVREIEKKKKKINENWTRKSNPGS